ncbi:MAG: SH3 domain-containing protein [Pseudomonadota bacterium]|nr:SH3 domain-containing protein [Pseudomonadota bacterium]
MEQAKQQRKIEEAMNRQKRSLKDTQAGSNSGFTFEKFFSTLNIRKNTSLVLIGVAAGVAITATAVWVKSGESGIENLSQNIDLLNKRVESLGDNITNLEVKLTPLLILADSNKDIESKHDSANQKNVSEIAEAKPAIDLMEPAAAGLMPEAAKNEAVFTPTHTAITNLNLRPSASIKITPVGILSTGTQVEKIGENGYWFHVNTEAYGKGWCSSKYLSPL